MKLFQAAALVCLILFAGLSAADSEDVSERNRVEQHRLFLERIESMKADSQGIFFAVSDLSADDQKNLAQRNLEEIRKLSEVSGFDSPDYGRILELAREILLRAPDTPTAQMAHWNIHTLFLIEEDRSSAARAMESYIFKYPYDEMRLLEACDKLSSFAGEEGEWGRSLYYADLYLEWNPENIALMLNRARALIGLGAFGEGAALLHRIIEENSESVQANLAADDLLKLEKGPAKVRETGDEPPPSRDTEPPKAAGTLDPKEKVQSDILLEKYRLTMARIKSLAVAVEVFSLHNMKPPAALSDLLPDYLEGELETDAWGNPFLYRAGTELGEYWIASGGSDGRFEGFDQKGLYSDLEGRDIIFSDGDFILSPEK